MKRKRRDLLVAAAVSVVAPVFWLRGASAATQAASAKVSKDSVHYRDTPNGREMCGNCRFFVPPGGHAGEGMMGSGIRGPAMMYGGTCTVVAGEVSPMGYCDLWASV